MNEVAVSLEQLAQRISRCYEEGLGLAASSVERFWMLGSWLIQAKELLPHGAWGSWVEEHCAFDVRTASRYMLLCRSYPSGAEARQALAELGKLTPRESKPSRAEPSEAVVVTEEAADRTYVEENAHESICDLLDAGRLNVAEAMKLSRLAEAEQQAAAILLTNEEGPWDSEQVDEVIAQVASQARKEPIYDSQGQEVPRRLREVFTDPFWDEALQQLRSIYQQVKAHPERYRYLLQFDITETLVKLEDALRLSRPVLVCPGCGGKRCAECLQTGWWPQTRFSAA